MAASRVARASSSGAAYLRDGAVSAAQSIKDGSAAAKLRDGASSTMTSLRDGSAVEATKAGLFSGFAAVSSGVVASGRAISAMTGPALGEL